MGWSWADHGLFIKNKKKFANIYLFIHPNAPLTLERFYKYVKALKG
jgi:hypothetical protein